MPEMKVNGVTLAYEEYGEGFPLIWCHDYSGSMRTWKPQISYFARRYRVIVYNARGYPPSEVPQDPEAYSQEQSLEDLRELMRQLGIDQAYVGGISMGGGLSVVFALKYPQQTKAIIVASAGSGSGDPETFRATQRSNAAELEQRGMDLLRARVLTMQPQMKWKNPVAWQEHIDQYLEHSPQGLAFTSRGVQGKRPSLYDFEEDLKKLTVPALVLIGDEDEPCREPGLFLRRVLPNSGLLVLPRTGHLTNQEEPEAFNRGVADFLTAVEAGKWPDC